MSNHSLYKQLNDTDTESIIFSYKGEINAGQIESIYSEINRVLEERKISDEKKKKIVYILIEAIQNIFHHQLHITSEDEILRSGNTGVVIRKTDNGSYNIITGNYILNNNKESIEKKIIEVNSHTPESLRVKYKKMLSENELSKKGGAGLGIIEMVRKSGRKLNFEFMHINDEYSFFTLGITIE